MKSIDKTVLAQIEKGNPQDPQTLAKIIIFQLTRGGGFGRLKMMVNGTPYIVENGVHITLPSYRKNVTITLRNDLYDIKIVNRRGGKTLYEGKGIYGEDLSSIVEDNTGLRFSF